MLIMRELTGGLYFGERFTKEVDGELGGMPKGIPMESLNETRNLVEAYLD